MRPRLTLLCALAATCLIAAGCSEKESGLGGGAEAKQQATAPAKPVPRPALDPRLKQKPRVSVPKPLPTQLTTKDLILGAGQAARTGDQVTVNYVGVSARTGKEFDSSFNAGQPFPFQLGAGQVIPGWDQGIAGMRIGGRRQLVIPPALAYGSAGSPPAIGPNETLVFVVDLLSIK
jgi:peptidylprolyl isomerase